jgi:rod shape determining protein RodA
VQLIVCAALIGTWSSRACLPDGQLLLIGLFSVGSIVFFYSADYVLNDVLEPHQRVRINVLLAWTKTWPRRLQRASERDSHRVGWPAGQGFPQWHQTKLKFVPSKTLTSISAPWEKRRASSLSRCVTALPGPIIRLIHMAERQPFKFGRVYGYCVLSIFLFHVFINVGMVLGLTPVIGIPLPFFSYGGSSLWGFTILLFIFLRIDAGRNLVRS